MKLNPFQVSTLKSLGIWGAACAAALALDASFPRVLVLSSGMSTLELLGTLAALLVLAELITLFTHWHLARKRRPAVEGSMVGRVYRLIALLSIGLAVAYGFGKLATFGTFFSLFGGMLLGWSLQAPVSGFAAWILISVMRPFRPGDRVQFPNLGLTGDVANTTPMYTYLNQVGGTIGSEEAVGRYILVPNAMLFSQVVINYIVVQESPYMLDEVTVRITYDSHWEAAEKILLDAAREVTREIIETTGVQPYIRSPNPQWVPRPRRCARSRWTGSSPCCSPRTWRRSSRRPGACPPSGCASPSWWLRTRSRGGTTSSPAICSSRCASTWDGRP